MPPEKKMIEIRETKKSFALGVHFMDGEIEHNGILMPHEQILGFNVFADSEAEAKHILRRHLSKCVETLDNELLRSIVPENRNPDKPEEHTGV